MKNIIQNKLENGKNRILRRDIKISVTSTLFGTCNNLSFDLTRTVTSCPTCNICSKAALPDPPVLPKSATLSGMLTRNRRIGLMKTTYLIVLIKYCVNTKSADKGGVLDLSLPVKLLRACAVAPEKELISYKMYGISAQASKVTLSHARSIPLL